jgi:hypothetical protein
MSITLALAFNLKSLLLLFAAIAFGFLAITGIIGAPRDDWKRVVSFAALCLVSIALFIWAAGG